jgi:copper chaperone NosL
MKAIVYAVLVVMAVVGSVTLVNGADDIAQVPSCKYCGMDRRTFAYSRMFIEYDNGTHEGFCSIHCAGVDLAVNIDKAPKTFLVGDYKTRDLIDAEQAVWVIGGSKMGVMTKRAKWAFKTKEEADAFIKEFGGSTATFDGAMKASFEDMYQDSKMIRERRAMKRKAMEQKKAPGQILK